MKNVDVVLLGYYGQGNFGDDILMIAADKIARELMPGGTIGVRLPDGPGYVSTLLGHDIATIPFGTRDRHRLIIHGGGGTFFDFSSYPASARIRNMLMLAGGSQAYVKVEAALRRILGKPRLDADTRIGLGIGVGTFARGSRKLLDALPVMSAFDHLWVRDLGSKANIEDIGVSVPVVVGSDLAFLCDAWCPSELTLQPRSERSARPRLGIILRDWVVASGANLATLLRPVIDELAIRYQVTIISLDPNTDAGVLATFKDFPQVIWQPGLIAMSDFLGAIADNDVLLTSRAHGAICGACLGRASVILEIEPKLAAVHAMLPSATRLAHPGSDAVVIGTLIEDAMAVSIDRIASDVQRNRKLSETALAAVTESVRH